MSLLLQRHNNTKANFVCSDSQGITVMTRAEGSMRDLSTGADCELLMVSGTDSTAPPHGRARSSQQPLTLLTVSPGLSANHTVHRSVRSAQTPRCPPWRGSHSEGSAQAPGLVRSVSSSLQNTAAFSAVFSHFGNMKWQSRGFTVQLLKFRTLQGSPR